MRSIYIYLGVFFLLFAGSLFMDFHYSPGNTRPIDATAFRQTHLEKKTMMEDYMEGFRDSILSHGIGGLNTDIYEGLSQIYHNKGLAFFIYGSHELRYWSVNSIPLPELDTLRNETVEQLGNGWYYIKQMRCDSFRVMGVELIRKTYSYENQYLNNAFQDDFRLPGTVRIVKDPAEGLAIEDEDGSYLLSLTPSVYQLGKTPGYYVSVVLFLT
ncbi:MAG TPA: hypothetical protein VJ876_03385, partial [Bacteroidales bacterium]|nr:hypothetical protein [Bacteroidales bacterium]